MATFMEMSLEDIINKKKKQNATRNINRKPKPPNKVVDARNKIISKKRTQIRDAREILAEHAKQKDARLKLQQLRAKRQSSQSLPIGNASKNRGKFPQPPHLDGRVFIDPSRQVTSQHINPSRSVNKNQINIKKGFFDNRAIAARMPHFKPIVRTVENDLQVLDDPMGDEYTPPKIELSNRHASLQLRITAHNSESQKKNTINHRSSVVTREKSPPRPPSILKKRPMAALRSEEKVEKQEKPVLEYRIIVSNLRNSVTGGDIEELFGDVGGMVESRLVRPGTAEVIYKSLDDAQRAVDLYHNRQLDGQPMNCLLVTPRSHVTAAKNSTKPNLYSTSSNVEPDISTFHKVLFSNF